MWQTGLQRTAIALCLALLGACSTSPKVVLPKAPEAATGYTEKPGWIAKKIMVATANPLATEAGYQVLRSGGSAVDAAIAVQLVLTLVEPQSSGIGGGAFLLHFDGKEVLAFDGRETAPSAAGPDLLRSKDGKVLDFHSAAIGGRAVGAPGVLRMMELAHRRYGKLPWATLFSPAIKLADDGFTVSPRLAALLKTETHLRRDPVAAAYFYDASGQPRAAGTVLKNPQLAEVLREVARDGADAFYRGRTASDIEARVKQHANPGSLTASDIGAYQARLRQPVCSDYKTWRVCGMPPPSSGGIAIAQMLGILEQKDLRALPPKNGMPDSEAIHLFAEAGRLAYADRDRYVADTDFVPLPGNSPRSLTDKTYLATRAALIGKRSMGVAAAGTPAGANPKQGRDRAPQRPSTTHLSIVDAHGNAVSMTSTIEDGFGSRLMVRGFLLNNELTDFSAHAADADGPVANRVQPGKRPRSSMSPTLVFERSSGKLVLAVGSPGGSMIVNYVAKTLVGTMDWGLNIQQAISLPNFGSRNGPTELEQGRFSPSLLAALRDKGHQIELSEQTSGLQGIMRLQVQSEEVWYGGADPRREGTVKGD